MPSIKKELYTVYTAYIAVLYIHTTIVNRSSIPGLRTIKDHS